jgi:hypothetical protein
MGGIPDFDYIDYTKVDSTANKMVVPREIYEKRVLTHPDELQSDSDDDDTDVGKAHWSYDVSIGWVVLSDRPLDGDITVQEGELFEDGVERVKYKTPTVRNPYTQQDENASWTLTIPKPFFSNSDSDGGGGLNTVPESVGFTHGERRHFVTAQKFLSDEPNEVKSCFVLTTDQLNTLLRNKVPADIPEGWTPQFI